MTDVEVTKGESVDRALKRLKNKLEAEGIMDEMRRLRAFETPVQRYRRKQRTAAKKTSPIISVSVSVIRSASLKSTCSIAVNRSTAIRVLCIAIPMLDTV